MAGGLYDRVSARGFPSAVAAGQTGAGALESQGSAAPPQDLTNSNPAQYSTLPGYQPDPVAELGGVPLLEGRWGMTGAGDNPDQTPRTHAAPGPGWAGSYDDPELWQVHENSVTIHSADFGALAPRIHSPNGLAQPDVDQWSANEAGESVLEPVSGQLQFMGGRDRIQGYNLSNRYGFDAGHRQRTTLSAPVVNAFVDSAERPFIVPQASGSFAPTDSVQGPPVPGFMRGAENLNATAQSAYVPPVDPELAPAGPPAGAPASLGWWS
jgi:hypothetical protein